MGFIGVNWAVESLVNCCGHDLVFTAIVRSFSYADLSVGLATIELGLSFDRLGLCKFLEHVFHESRTRSTES